MGSAFILRGTYGVMWGELVFLLAGMKCLCLPSLGKVCVLSRGVGLRIGHGLGEMLLVFHVSGDFDCSHRIQWRHLYQDLVEDRLVTTLYYCSRYPLSNAAEIDPFLSGIEVEQLGRMEPCNMYANQKLVHDIVRFIIVHILHEDPKIATSHFGALPFASIITGYLRALYLLQQHESVSVLLSGSRTRAQAYKDYE